MAFSHNPLALHTLLFIVIIMTVVVILYHSACALTKWTIVSSLSLGTDIHKCTLNTAAKSVIAQNLLALCRYPAREIMFLKVRLQGTKFRAV